MHPIAKDLLNWYQEHARDLPWRGSQDPYAIWVSEVMLQQTRVETVIPYFNRWMERFPTIQSLAAADLDEVLNLWEGMGYYRRARYLHQAAQLVADSGQGELPRSTKALRELPGIGEYTAAAIGSIAFDQDAIALDGNLKRVLARLFSLKLEVQTSQAKQMLRQQALEILPPGQAAEFNQALMDLGASVCTPQKPDCPNCPLNQHCQAYLQGIQAHLPIRKTRQELPEVPRAAAILFKGEQVLVGRRPAEGLLGGLWEFPGLDLKPVIDPLDQLIEWLQREVGIRAGQWQPAGSYQHAYSHFKVQVDAYQANWVEGQPKPTVHSELRWHPVGQLDQLPMGKVDRAIASDLPKRSSTRDRSA